MGPWLLTGVAAAMKDSVYRFPLPCLAACLLSCAVCVVSFPHNGNKEGLKGRAAGPRAMRSRGFHHSTRSQVLWRESRQTVISPFTTEVPVVQRSSGALSFFVLYHRQETGSLNNRRSGFHRNGGVNRYTRGCFKSAPPRGIIRSRSSQAYSRR